MLEDQRNENPKPFIWAADADLILGKIERLSKRISRSGQIETRAQGPCELRRIAHRYVRRESLDGILHSTALVNEAIDAC